MSDFSTLALAVSPRLCSEVCKCTSTVYSVHKEAALGADFTDLLTHKSLLYGLDIRELIMKVWNNYFIKTLYWVQAVEVISPPPPNQTRCDDSEHIAVRMSESKRAHSTSPEGGDLDSAILRRSLRVLQHPSLMTYPLSQQVHSEKGEKVGRIAPRNRVENQSYFCVKGPWRLQHEKLLKVPP